MSSIFEKFGGIRPMAEKLGLPPSTVKSWHAKGFIPEWRRDRIIEIASEHQIVLTRAEVDLVLPDSEPLRRGAPARVEPTEQAAA